MLRNLFFSLFIIFAGVALWSCSEEEYTSLPGFSLSFSADTIRFDTVFSSVPTSARSFWVYNKTEKSLRCSSVRLERGQQSGFRVNVDGVYLGQQTGFASGDIEILRGDSIRVFVELTSSPTGQQEPQLVEDNLIFTLESGAVCRVNINAHSWDAQLLRSPVVSEDLTLTGEKPIVVYGPLTVEEGATLTLDAGTQLYFNGDASLDVHGRLVANGTPEAEVVLRGSRLDRMFDYLPYDNVSGQWQGVHFYETSYGNELTHTDIHSAFDGIRVDSCDVERKTLEMLNSTIHNCQGYGLVADAAWVELRNCQLSNTLADCLSTAGGVTLLNNCTLAQFYPFDSQRGVALRFTNRKAPQQLLCYNTLVTGYADDEIMGESADGEAVFAYTFHNCILRTPEPDEQTDAFAEVLFENDKDTLSTSSGHFRLVDHNMQRYDFHLDSLSSAIGRADAEHAMPFDRDGLPRDDKPDIGCYEHFQKQDPQIIPDEKNRVYRQRRRILLR